MKFWEYRTTVILSGLLLLVLACASPASRPTPEPSSTPTPSAEAQAGTGQAEAALHDEKASHNRRPQGPPPQVDTSIASVPLEDIVFDTFNGGFLRLSEASASQIEALRDRIAPIYQPKYDSVEGGDWLADEDKVMGYVSEGGDAYAYPVKILNFHEIVNDVIDGQPVLVSYCPLCASGVVYSRELNGQTLLFGNTSALYQSDMVMYDHQTGSYWFQVLGEAIVGPLTGERLPLLPSVTTTWGQWKQEHPDTQVLSRDLGLLEGSPYDRDPFQDYASRVDRGRFAFPVDESRLDDRLSPGDLVIALQVEGRHRAYPLTGRPDAAINDEVGGREVLVVRREEGPSASAFFRRAGDRSLSFRLEDGTLVDVETGSRWTDGGRAISGPLAGTQLERVPSRTGFWFSLVGAVPGLELYSDGSGA